jgi:hypothetical protein
MLTVKSYMVNKQNPGVTFLLKRQTYLQECFSGEPTVQIMDEINLPAADPEKNNSCVHEKCQIA